MQHIYRHYREDLSAAGVARAFGISVQQLNRTLLCQVELNFEDFLALIRVNRACKLLTTTRMTVLDIALEVGYRNAKTPASKFSSPLLQKTRCRSPGSGFLCGPPGTSAPTGALSAILCRDNHRSLPPCKSPENRVY